eukprot:357160-Chlamydomonas_euryale.AAC.1
MAATFAGCSAVGPPTPHPPVEAPSKGGQPVGPDPPRRHQSAHNREAAEDDDQQQQDGTVRVGGLWVGHQVCECPAGECGRAWVWTQEACPSGGRSAKVLGLKGGKSVGSFEVWGGSGSMKGSDACAPEQRAERQRHAEVDEQEGEEAGGGVREADHEVDDDAPHKCVRNLTRNRVRQGPLSSQRQMSRRGGELSHCMN